MNRVNAEMLWYWIREREAIRKRKQSGAPRPWTDDQILHRQHFCNVRREHDRTTVELHNVRKEHGVPLDEMPAYYTLARLFNYAPSVKTIMMLGPQEGARTLRLAKQGGAKVFHTAYVVSTCGKSMDKIDYCIDLALRVGGIDEVPRDSLEKAHQRLMDIDGLGSFMAGQIVADLKNSPYLDDAYDWHHWACIGPGSKKGLEYIFENSITEKNFLAYLQALYEAMPQDIHEMNIHAQDLQNCLCEFSKYYRYRTGGSGRVRNYNPEA